MKMTDFLGEATEYDKKQAVERRKMKSWLKSVRFHLLEGILFWLIFLHVLDIWSVRAVV
ncbi:MAG: hypothetical protein ACI4D3_16125 [Lachnospiraceae bacterium]